MPLPWLSMQLMATNALRLVAAYEDRTWHVESGLSQRQGFGGLFKPVVMGNAELIVMKIVILRNRITMKQKHFSLHEVAADFVGVGMVGDERNSRRSLDHDMHGCIGAPLPGEALAEGSEQYKVRKRLISSDSWGSPGVPPVIII